MRNLIFIIFILSLNNQVFASFGGGGGDKNDGVNSDKTMDLHGRMDALESLVRDLCVENQRLKCEVKSQIKPSLPREISVRIVLRWNHFCSAETFREFLSTRKYLQMAYLGGAHIEFDRCGPCESLEREFTVLGTHFVKAVNCHPVF